MITSCLKYPSSWVLRMQVDMDAMNDTYFEVIGTPIDGSTIKMVNCCNLGDHLSAFCSPMIYNVCLSVHGKT